MFKIKNFIKSNFFILALFFITVGVFLLNLRINIFRYNNFDYGKFDLGNMTQMVWNTLNGRFMYLTDYFGANIPRWAMSHVDPILLLFVPFFALFEHPMTLVIGQLLLLLFSSLIIFKIAQLQLKSQPAAFFIGLAYLFYPAVGFLSAWTGFHGVTAVIPFFLGAFYVFESMYTQNKYNFGKLFIFWVLIVLTLSGKEQIGLYIASYGVFIILFRNGLSGLNLNALWKSRPARLGAWVFTIGTLWFIAAFLIIIPAYAKYRVESFNNFADSLDIDTDLTRDVALPNYFLSRYEGFGDSYAEVVIGALKNPRKVVLVTFGGDKIDNLRETFAPVAFLPLAYPPLFALAVPDLLINYLTTAGGIGTSEIYNHRISMIIPVLFISSIYAIAFFSRMLCAFSDKMRVKTKIRYGYAALLLSLLFLISNFYTTVKYNNPVYLWFTQAVQKKLFASLVYAKVDTQAKSEEQIGQIYRLTKLENKDRECAEKIIGMIPEDASVSGPDYLGAHLSMRETYAIFPALYKEADFVIIDVFSKKILNILDLDLNLVRDVTGDIIKNPGYKLVTGCGNLFVFEKVGPHNKTDLLPLQEKFTYNEKYNYEIFQKLFVVDYELPQKFTRGETLSAKFVYSKKGDNSLDDYLLFTSFVNTITGEVYQAANLPSYSLIQPREWTENYYYVEYLEISFPKYLDPGTYKAFVGMTNNIRTRSLYLGNVEVL